MSRSVFQYLLIMNQVSQIQPDWLASEPQRAPSLLSRTGIQGRTDTFIFPCGFWRTEFSPHPCVATVDSHLSNLTIHLFNTCLLSVHVVPC